MMAKYQEELEEERILRVASLVEKFESEIRRQTQSDLKTAVKTIQMCQALRAGVQRDHLPKQRHPLQRSDSESEDLYYPDHSQDSAILNSAVIEEQPRVRTRVLQINRFAQLKEKCTEILSKNVRRKAPAPPLLPRPKSFGAVTRYDAVRGRSTADHRSSPGRERGPGLLSRTFSLQKEVEMRRVRKKSEEEEFEIVNYEDCEVHPAERPIPSPQEQLDRRDEGRPESGGCEEPSRVSPLPVRRATAPVRQASMQEEEEEEEEEEQNQDEEMDEECEDHTEKAPFRLFEPPSLAETSSCEYAAELRRRLSTKLTSRQCDLELEGFIGRCWQITGAIHPHLEVSSCPEEVLLQYFLPPTVHLPPSPSESLLASSVPESTDQSEDSDWSEGEAMEDSCEISVDS